jgi:hypothetical protein
MWISLFKTNFVSKKNSVAVLAAGTVAWVGLIEVAFAGATAVPGPVAGAGLPGVAVAGGILWLFGKFRNRR